MYTNLGKHRHVACRFLLLSICTRTKHSSALSTPALGATEEGREAPRTAVNPSLLCLLLGSSTASADGASPVWEALGQVLGPTKERQGPFPQGVHSPVESGQDLSQDIDTSVTAVPIQAREGDVLPPELTESAQLRCRDLP